MFTKEQIEEAFEAKKVIKQLEEKEERRESTKEIEAANSPEAKQREQETKKALLARIAALEDRLKKNEESEDRSFGVGPGFVEGAPRKWHEGLSYNDMLKQMRLRGDIR